MKPLHSKSELKVKPLSFILNPNQMRRCGRVLAQMSWFNAVSIHKQMIQFNAIKILIQLGAQVDHSEHSEVFNVFSGC